MSECQGCKYFFRYGDDKPVKSTIGCCKRYPPHQGERDATIFGYSVSPETVNSFWPDVREDDWCGEHAT